MKPADLFVLAYLPCEIGIPFAGMRLLRQAAANQSPTSAYGQKLEAQARAFSAHDADTRQQIEEIEALLRAAGQPVPPSPNAPRWDEYVVWMRELRKRVGDDALSQFGLALGDVYHSIAITVVITSLQETAPDPSVLANEAKQLGEHLKQSVAQLDAAARSPALPEEVRAVAGKTPAAAALAPALALRRLGVLVAEIRNALAG